MSKLPELPKPFALHCGIHLDPPKPKQMFGEIYGDDQGVKQFLFTAEQMREYAERAVRESAQTPRSLLREPTKHAPKVCSCQPGKCSAPQPNWCCDPAKAKPQPDQPAQEVDK